MRKNPQSHVKQKQGILDFIWERARKLYRIIRNQYPRMISFQFPPWQIQQFTIFFTAHVVYERSSWFWFSNYLIRKTATYRGTCVAEQTTFSLLQYLNPSRRSGRGGRFTSPVDCLRSEGIYGELGIIPGFDKSIILGRRRITWGVPLRTGISQFSHPYVTL